MYSGSDSTESQKYPQWALNPAAYQNMANDQVDWAALAQQWIIMKEAGPPPIPGEQPVNLNEKKESLNAGGEAPMDVENGKEEIPWNASEPPPPPPPGAEVWNWNAQSQSWNWNNAWGLPPGPVPPAPSVGPMKPPLLPTPPFSATAESSGDNAPLFSGYNSSQAGSEANSSGYWAGSSSHKQIKPHNKRYSKVNVPIRAPAPLPMPALVPPPVTPPALDAARRKQLPAWIREGLEKMEKDKVRQLEREREKVQRDDQAEKSAAAVTEKQAIEMLRSTMKRQKSKFDSEGENSEEEQEIKKKMFSPEPPVPLTSEELMVKVRRTMTEILLKVTNRLIAHACREEHARMLKKRASDRRSTAPSGGANVSSKLGVGIYGGESASSSGSGSGSGSGSDDEYDGYRNENDSDSELKNAIKRKMSDFEKTEREIEDKLDEADKKKGANRDATSRSSSSDTNDLDSQVDARTPGNHPSRCRSAHETKAKAQSRRSSSSSSDNSGYSNGRSQKMRRSSSSDSNDYKSRKRDRSVSPDRRRKTRRYSRSKSPRRKSRRSDSRGVRSNPGRKFDGRSRSSNRSSAKSSHSRKSRKSRSKERSRRSRSRNRSGSRSRQSRRSSRSRSRSSSRRFRKRNSRSSSSGRGKRSYRN